MSFTVALLVATLAACGGTGDGNWRAEADPADITGTLDTLDSEAAVLLPNEGGSSDAAAVENGSAAQRSRLSLADASPLQADAQAYVTVRSGHLYRGERRLRQWGVNLQSGYFLTYPEIDRLVVRMQGLGFNALRIWPTSGTFYVPTESGPVPATARMGDGSPLDRYDYLVYKASQAGMTIQMTALHYLDLPTLRGVRDPVVASWVSSAKDDAQLRLLHGFAPYVSKEYLGLLKQHISTQLSRVNPYTGRRYADEPAVSAWELGNEAHFVDCALTPNCVAGLPTVAREALSSRWQSTKLNTSKQPLPADMGAFIAGTAYPAYAQWVAQTFVSASRALRSHAQAVGGPSSGVAVQPFIFNTGPTTPNAVAHFAYSRGDVFSIGAYRSPLQDDGALEGSAWLPVAAGGKKLPSYLNHVKVEGKPMIVYETSFFRPYSYRAEWGPLMAALALQQDWDGVFLYQYGQPNAIYSASGRPEGYGTVPLPEPSAYSAESWKRDYTYGFHHGGDPVAMGSWSIASRLFTAVTETAPLQQVWRLPLSGIYAKPAGYPAGYFDAASGAAKLGSVAIAFVGDESKACSPCTLSINQPSSFSVRWPSPSQSVLVLESPAGRAVTGLLGGELGELADGISASVSQPGFGIAAVLRRIDELGSTIGHTLQVVGEVSNTGMLFDRSMVDYASPVGAIYGLQAQGVTPLVYRGPTMDVRFPVAVNVQSEDFGLQSVGSPVAGTTVRIAAEAGRFRLSTLP